MNDVTQKDTGIGV